MKTWLFLLLGCLLLRGVADASVSEAEDAFMRKDYVTARRLLEEPALAGDIKAQDMLGHMLLFGRGGPVDVGRAETLLLRAAERGSAEAQNSLGVLYMTGVNGKVDMPEGLKWFHRAAEGGQANAMFNLGRIAEQGIGQKPSLLDAKAWYARAAARGSEAAKIRLEELLAPETPSRRAARLKYRLDPDSVQGVPEPVRVFRQALPSKDAGLDMYDVRTRRQGNRLRVLFKMRNTGERPFQGKLQFSLISPTDARIPLMTDAAESTIRQSASKQYVLPLPDAVANDDLLLIEALSGSGVIQAVRVDIPADFTVMNPGMSLLPRDMLSLFEAKDWPAQAGAGSGEQAVSPADPREKAAREKAAIITSEPPVLQAQAPARSEQPAQPAAQPFLPPAPQLPVAQAPAAPANIAPAATPDFAQTAPPAAPQPVRPFTQTLPAQAAGLDIRAVSLSRAGDRMRVLCGIDNTRAQTFRGELRFVLISRGGVRHILLTDDKLEVRGHVDKEYMLALPQSVPAGAPLLIEVLSGIEVVQYGQAGVPAVSAPASPAMALTDAPVPPVPSVLPVPSVPSVPPVPSDTPPARTAVPPARPDAETAVAERPGAATPPPPPEPASPPTPKPPLPARPAAQPATLPATLPATSPAAKPGPEASQSVAQTGEQAAPPVPIRAFTQALPPQAVGLDIRSVKLSRRDNQMRVSCSLSNTRTRAFRGELRLVLISRGGVRHVLMTDNKLEVLGHADKEYVLALPHTVPAGVPLLIEVFSGAEVVQYGQMGIPAVSPASPDRP